MVSHQIKLWEAVHIQSESLAGPHKGVSFFHCLTISALSVITTSTSIANYSTLPIHFLYQDDAKSNQAGVCNDLYVSFSLLVC